MRQKCLTFNGFAFNGQTNFLKKYTKLNDSIHLCHSDLVYFYNTVERGYSGQWGYSGHFLFYFYFEQKDIFEQSKCPQLLVTYPRMYQK